LILLTARYWWILFAAWLTVEKTFQEADALLLLVLKIQPSEIDALELDDYWCWVNVAQKEIKRRSGQ